MNICMPGVIVYRIARFWVAIGQVGRRKVPFFGLRNRGAWESIFNIYPH